MDNHNTHGKSEGCIRRFMHRAPGYCIRSLIAAIALLFVLCIYVLVAPLALYDRWMNRRRLRIADKAAVR